MFAAVEINWPIPDSATRCQWMPPNRRHSLVSHSMRCSVFRE